VLLVRTDIIWMQTNMGDNPTLHFNINSSKRTALLLLFYISQLQLTRIILRPLSALSLDDQWERNITTGLFGLSYSRVFNKEQHFLHITIVNH
jgi:hypothetical protein